MLNYFSFALEQTYTFLGNFNISRGMNLDMVDQEQEGSGTKTNGYLETWIFDFSSC